MMIVSEEPVEGFDGEGDTAVTAASSVIGDAFKHVEGGNEYVADDGDAEKDVNVKEEEEGGDDESKANGHSGDPCNDKYKIDNNADGRFDHTSRKVVVHNILKYIRHKELQKLVASWLVGHESKNIKIVATKKPPKDNWVKVTLAEESMVNSLIEVINTGGVGGNALLNGRGKPLFAKRADEMFVYGDGGDGGNGQKRKERHPDGNGGGEKGCERDNENNKRLKSSPEMRILSSDEVRDAITPLWKITYPQQLDSKMKEMVNKCAKCIVKEIKFKFKILEREAKRGQRNTSIQQYDWVNQLRAIEMDQPIPSPLRYEYRNKCEFTIGWRLVPGDLGEGGDNSLTPTTTGRGNEGVDAAPTAGDGATKEGDDSEVEKAATANLNTTTNSHTSTTTRSSSSTAHVEFRKVPAAGFLPQGWNGGVYSPHPLQNMPDWSCGIADIFDDFLQTSTIPPYDSKIHRGVWRTVTVRCSLRTRECMLIVVHAPATGGAGARDDGSDDYTLAFEDEKARLVGMLTKGVIPKPKRDFPDCHRNDNYAVDISGATTSSPATGMKKSGTEQEKEVESNNDDGGICVTSIYFQEYEGLSLPSPDHPVQHIYGKKYLEEKLGKCTFQISPGAFFQTNTEGAEVLYNIVVDRIREVTSEPQRTLLLDVCCGTGTIGLTCLKEGVVGALVGVDIAEPAIADARINAMRNGFRQDETACDAGVATTTRFVASAAEKVLPEVMRDISSGGVRGAKTTPPVVIAVVDPARDGLHGIVVRTLRANEWIQRLIYVSCNPVGTLTRDAAMLCGPPTKKYPGRPFKPTRSQPVDMFPMTKHCEMVMTFDRMSKEEYERYQT